MSAYTGNIFNFSRDLPEPFDTLSNKKVKVTSKYSDGATASTLCSTVIKAINAICRCKNSTGEGAVGIIDQKTVAEYKSSMGPDAYHLVVYNRDNGNIMASIYDKSTEIFENYILNSSGRDGAAVMMAMFPVLMEDAEFEENFEEYYNQFVSAFPDMTKATNAMAMLCDNAYRRVKDENCAAHVKVGLDKAGNLMRVSQAQLDSGKFEPTEVVAGEFNIFARKGATPIKKATAVIEHSDFVGKYGLSSRTFNPSEQALVPQLPSWYIIPDEVVDICKHAQATTGKPMQMRNFLLRGPAGTGKTMGAKAIAAGLNLPYMKYTCSAGTEIFDFVGMIFPDTDSGTTGDAQLDAENAVLKNMGGMNYENVSKLMNLPGLDDMDYDPEGVYEALTGSKKAGASAQDCMAIVLDKVTEKVKALSKRSETSTSSGQSYTYVETDFIKALKHGYVIEIQEPSTIVQPGVLVGLNSLLEQTGSITLPTGEVIQRHPDAVVIVTTNVSYEGCRGMNQSVIDRMSLVRDIEMPTPEVMVQRAMSVTGATDEHQVSQMVQVLCDLSEYCRKNSITDGSYGMRSLIDWVASAEVTGDVYDSALYTIISKATADEMDREALISAVLEPYFTPKRRKASA